MKAAETGESPESAGKIQGRCKPDWGHAGLPAAAQRPGGRSFPPFSVSPERAEQAFPAQTPFRPQRAHEHEPLHTGGGRSGDKENSAGSLKKWSGKRDLNPRPPAWEASTLPLSYSRTGCRKILERETGFEPATSTMARLHSTAELLPLNEKGLYAGEPFPSSTFLFFTKNSSNRVYR